MFRPRPNYEACGCTYCTARYPVQLDRDFFAIMQSNFGVDEEYNLRLLADAVETHDAITAAKRYLDHPEPPVSAPRIRNKAGEWIDRQHRGSR